MNWKIFNASRVHMVLLGLTALVIVTATMWTPQKAYTKDELVMSCGKPFNFITVSDVHKLYEDASLPYADSCTSWNYFDYPPDANLILYGIDVFIVFAFLFGLVVVLPRLIGTGYHPFRLLDDGENFRAVLVPTLVTALIISSFYTVQINVLKIGADNDYFSAEEARELVLRENPSLSEYRFDAGSKSIIFTPTGYMGVEFAVR
jgi:hypothetical protein